MKKIFQSSAGSGINYGLKSMLWGVWVFFFFCLPVRVVPQDKQITGKWSDNTAMVIEKGKWESGIFQTFRLGMNSRAELKSQVLLMPALPNAGIKLSMVSGKSFFLATEHSVSYPSLFLNLVSFKGTGGLISPQYQFPFIASFTNSVLVSKPAGNSCLLTFTAGLSFCIRKDKPDYQSTIDIPFIYQRMAHYYKGATLKSGISVKGNLTGNLFFEELARIMLVTRGKDNIFVENAGTLMWSGKGSFRIKAGYLLSWGSYPFGTHLQVWPTVDFIFGSRARKTS